MSKSTTPLFQRGQRVSIRNSLAFVSFNGTVVRDTKPTDTFVEVLPEFALHAFAASWYWSTLRIRPNNLSRLKSRSAAWVMNYEIGDKVFVKRIGGVWGAARVVMTSHKSVRVKFVRDHVLQVVRHGMDILTTLPSKEEEKVQQTNNRTNNPLLIALNKAFPEVPHLRKYTTSYKDGGSRVKYYGCSYKFRNVKSVLEKMGFTNITVNTSLEGPKYKYNLPSVTIRATAPAAA